MERNWRLRVKKKLWLNIIIHIVADLISSRKTTPVTNHTLTINEVINIRTKSRNEFIFSVLMLFLLLLFFLNSQYSVFFSICLNNCYTIFKAKYYLCWLFPFILHVYLFISRPLWLSCNSKNVKWTDTHREGVFIVDSAWIPCIKIS